MTANFVISYKYAVSFSFRFHCCGRHGIVANTSILVPVFSGIDIANL